MRGGGENPHDAFVDLEGALEIVVRSKKSKAPALFVSQETHKKIIYPYLGSKVVQQLYYSLVHYHLLLSQHSQVLRDRILATTFSPLQKEHVDFRLPC